MRTFSLFSLAPSREARLLAAKMRTGFQFVVLTGVAVEEEDYYGGTEIPRGTAADTSY